MKITNLANNLELYTSIGGSRLWDDQSKTEKSIRVACEHYMDIYVNNVFTLQVICTPNDLAELVVGRLFTENIIQSIDDIKNINICEDGSRATVLLNDDIAKEDEDVMGSFINNPNCCTRKSYRNNTSFNKPVFSSLPPLEPIILKDEWIFNLAAKFEKNTPLFEATHAAHSCYLAMEDQLLFICEDIGRHNALDKTIGKALINNYDLSKCILFSSGRLPTEMVSKVIKARIPVLASKTIATDKSVLLAKKHHLTLLVYAKNDRYTILTDYRKETLMDKDFIINIS